METLYDWLFIEAVCASGSLLVILLYALFLDGLLRILGIIPPYMDLDVNVVDDIVERVEQDILPQVQKYQRYIPGLWCNI